MRLLKLENGPELRLLKLESGPELRPLKRKLNDSMDGDGRNLERASLADNLSELEMVPNPDQRAFEDWSDAESDDDGSDSDSE